VRALVRETRLARENLILPLFACPGEGVRREVSSMPGVFNLSVDEIAREAANAFEAEPAGRSLHAWIIGIPAQICSARLGALAAWRSAEADRHTATYLTRAASPHPARVWVTVRTGASPSDFSANLRAPILVADGRGHQVINEASDAPVRAVLFADDVVEAAA